MGYGIELPRITLRYNGLFDLDGMYAAVIDWAKNYGFRWHEVDYKHKVPGGGAEQEMKWLLEKKVDEYAEFSILFTIHMWDLVEVEVEGQHPNLSNARFYIYMDANIKFDWQGSLKNTSRFTAFLGKWYNERLLKREMDEYFDVLYYRLWNLHALMKKYFDMQTKKYAYKGYLGEN
jgi:hypothetical protein